MSFQQSASYVKATGGSSRIDLPVVSMEVRAKPIVPEGGTAQMDYDDRAWFEAPTFRLTLTMTWGFERTDYKPGFQDTLQDLMEQYMTGNDSLDFHVKYTGSVTNYDHTQYDSEYVCPDMVPDMKEGDAGLVFNDQAREKERTILLKSKSSKLPWADVKFTFD